MFQAVRVVMLNRAGELVRQIAAVVERKVSDIISRASCFSILSDGSQARKTGGDKELVSYKMVRIYTNLLMCGFAEH